MVNQAGFEARNVKTRAMWEKACSVIVGGGQGHKRPAGQMKLGGPAFIARGSGARFWDVDGNEYLDYLMSYGPIVLGYDDPDVNRAVAEQMQKGTIYDVEHPLTVELAEKILKQIVESASGTTEAVAEVTRATQEQSSGAAQILDTSSNMHHITQQLAEAAKEQVSGTREIMKYIISREVYKEAVH